MARDALGSGEIAFNRDDERAQRVSGLALMLMNASSPVPTASVRSVIYPGRSDEAFERAFLRDRGTLAELGLAVEQVGPGVGRDGGWVVDPAALVETSGLTDEEALVIDLMCQPLCSDPTFPYGRDLMLALAKVNNSFEDVLPSVPGFDLAELPRPALGLRSALLRRVGCDVDYSDASDRVTKRRVAALGTFGLRGNLYFVTCPIDETGLVDDRVRSLRADRILASNPVDGLSYEVPEDFCVEDFVRLPFQLGTANEIGRFLVPAGREGEVRGEVLSGGSFESEGGQLVLEAPVADVTVAAVWAVAQGVVPIGPQHLMDAYRQVLEGVLENVR